MNHMFRTIWRFLNRLDWVYWCVWGGEERRPWVIRCLLTKCFVIRRPVQIVCKHPSLLSVVPPPFFGTVFLLLVSSFSSGPEPRISLHGVSPVLFAINRSSPQMNAECVIIKPLSKELHILLLHHLQQLHSVRHLQSNCHSASYITLLHTRFCQRILSVI